MSVCTPGTCPHGERSFIWLGDGPWLGNKTDRDYGHYPWVHAAPVGPGHLEVCDRKPFATAAEAGEAVPVSAPKLIEPEQLSLWGGAA